MTPAKPDHPLPRQELSGLVPALALLLEAHELATAVQRDQWQFAIEIKALTDAGLNHNHVRSLICQKLALHRLEVTRRGAEQRSFASPRGMRLQPNSCFVLSESGLVFARANRPDPPHAFPAGGPHGGAVNGHAVPVWDMDRRELRLGARVIKRYRRPAPSQETILSAFQEEGWPPRIDNPLSDRGNSDAVDRLHDAVKKLNRHARAVLRFWSDGNGLGAQWELRGAIGPS